MDTRSASRPTIVIVGGGFAGLEAAKALRRAPAHVIVIDRRNHFLFQPLLYQVATAALSPGNIAAPIRAVLSRYRNVRVLLGEVVAIDLPARQVRLADGETVAYDYLVLAAGSRTTYFGHDAWMSMAPGLKTVEDALEIRRRVLMAFEAAERESDPAHRARLMTFIVIGGGPTGVELAGALAEIARHTMQRDFRLIDTTTARIVLVDAGPRLLATFPTSLSASAARQLRGLGVEVRSGMPVSAVDQQGITAGGERIEAATVLWAAGVAAVPLAATLGVPVDRAGRLIVAPDLRLPDEPTTYVAGDLASLPVPGVAPAAMQMGRAVAANIERQLRGQPTQPFRYWNKGNVATIGRARGVADFGWLRLSGFPAWATWLFVHIWYLVGFDNRLLVFGQWAWSYITFQRSARLITGDPRLPIRRSPAATPAAPLIAAPPVPAPAPPATIDEAPR